MHAIVEASALPYVEELTRSLRDRADALGRSVLVIAESASDDPRIVRPSAAGGWGLDASWNDDFHHALHVSLTGERQGYYGDYNGVDDLAKAEVEVRHPGVGRLHEELRLPQSKNGLCTTHLGTCAALSSSLRRSWSSKS